MISKKMLVLTGSIGIIQSFFYFFNLPQKVAIHFGPQGIPNGWTSNTNNLIAGLLLFTFLNVLWLLIPLILKKMPIGLINFPEKEYWLSPERIDESIVTIKPWFYIMGTVINIFLISTMHIVFLTNKNTHVKLNMIFFWIKFSSFMIFMLIWIILLYKKFNRIPSS